jgi:hypothetical protein
VQTLPDGWTWDRSLRYATRVVRNTRPTICHSDAEWLANFAMYRTWNAHVKHDFTPERWRGCLRVSAQRMAVTLAQAAPSGMNKHGQTRYESPPPEVVPMSHAAGLAREYPVSVERDEMLSILPPEHRQAAELAAEGRASREIGAAMNRCHSYCIKLLRESGEILKAAGYGMGRASA